MNKNSKYCGNKDRASCKRWKAEFCSIVPTDFLSRSYCSVTLNQRLSCGALALQLEGCNSWYPCLNLLSPYGTSTPVGKHCIKLLKCYVKRFLLQRSFRECWKKLCWRYVIFDVTYINFILFLCCSYLSFIVSWVILAIYWLFCLMCTYNFLTEIQVLFHVKLILNFFCP